MQYFETAGNRAAGALLASQQAQQHFGVKVLAHLVDDADIHAERRRIMLGQDDGMRGFATARAASAKPVPARHRQRNCHPPRRRWLWREGIQIFDSR